MSDSEWSDKFSLDTVGSSGTVTCKFKGHTLEVSHVQVLAGHRRQLGHRHVQVQGSHARGKPAVYNVHTVG